MNKAWRRDGEYDAGETDANGYLFLMLYISMRSDVFTALLPVSSFQ